MSRIHHPFRLLLLATFTAFLIFACSGNSSQHSSDSANETELSCRTIQHLMGETCVSENPQRVVVLGLDLLGNSLALGIEPIGAARFDTSSDFPSYLFENRDQANAEKISNLGGHSNPNLETILRSNPDLIVGSKEHTQIYDKLSQIASTVLIDEKPGDWENNFEVLANALNKTKRADQLLQDYKTRIIDFKQKMESRQTIPEVSVVNTRQDHVRLYLKKIFIGTILQEAGLPRPPAQERDEYHAVVSLESISEMDGDVIFVMHWGNEEFKKKLQRHPLWFQLKAVQQGKVYEVNTDYWFGSNIIAANLVLDDLFTYLLPKDT